jgi:hypothetical protein
MIDSTIMRAHVSAPAQKGRLFADRRRDLSTPPPRAAVGTA